MNCCDFYYELTKLLDMPYRGDPLNVDLPEPIGTAGTEIDMEIPNRVGYYQVTL